MINKKFLNQGVQCAERELVLSPNSIPSGNLDQPPCKFIDTPSSIGRNSLRRGVFFFANAGTSFFVLMELLGILILKEFIVYEPNLFILWVEIIVSVIMVIFNFKEGLK